MRCLIGCEESGVVRDAFAALGHDAWSNDLVPARNGGKHLQMDVFEAMRRHGPWDLVILHPICDKMALCGNKHYGRGKSKHNERIEALEWTYDLWVEARHCARIGCVMENPASVLFPYLKEREPGLTIQYVQPYQFGHMEQKKTGLAIYGVPPLVETNNVYDEMMNLPKNVRERVFFMAPSATRKRDRSTTYAGLAAAMALQWGGDIRKEKAA